MNRFTQYIGRQFGNPHGLMGKVVCVIMNVINKKMYINTISSLDLQKNDNLLDIDYGNGYLLRLAYRKQPVHFLRNRYFGRYASFGSQKNKKAHQAHQLHLSVGDCCHLHYADDFFDAVTSVNTVYFWEDTVKGLREIHRCLKKGACFYNVVYTQEWLDSLEYTKEGFKKFSPNELKAQGYQAGYTEITVKDIVKGKSFAVIYKK